MERIGLAPGTEVGGYRILAPLGSGGMGAVYRAADGGGVEVALKLLHPHIGADADARERLRREVAALQRLCHPAVAAVLDAEADSTEAFIVTELIPGENLADHVRTHGPLAPGSLTPGNANPAGLTGTTSPGDTARLIALASGLRDALAAVHAAGVVHRDLKPSNVILTSDGPVLIDFGIAQGLDDARMTSTGVVLGTPGYLAPELLDGTEPTADSDWWGWAAVLTFAVTGRDPFGARPVEAVLARARAGDVDLAGVPHAVADALRAALHPDPTRRLVPEAVLEALDEAAHPHAANLTAANLTAANAANPSSESPPTSGTVTWGPNEGQTRALPVDTGADAGMGTDADTGEGSGEGSSFPHAQLANDGQTRALPVDVGSGEGSSSPHAQLANDGQTRAFLPDVELDDATRFSDDAHSRDFPPDHRVGDGGLDPGDPDDGLGEVDPDAYVPPVPQRRPVSLLFLALLVVAAAPLAPGIAVMVVAAVVLVFVTVESAGSALEARRARRGPGRADGLRTATAVPWHLLRGGVIALPSLVVALSVVVVVGGIAWWALDTGRLAIADNPPWVYQCVIALAVLAGLVTLWWGPFATATRVGARRTLGRLAPGRSGALVLIALTLVCITASVVLILTGEPTWWWPLPGPPSLS